jgi:hypothetical protein
MTVTHPPTAWFARSAATRRREPPFRRDGLGRTLHA